MTAGEGILASVALLVFVASLADFERTRPSAPVGSLVVAATSGLVLIILLLPVLKGIFQ